MDLSALIDQTFPHDEIVEEYKVRSFLLGTKGSGIGHIAEAFAFTVAEAAREPWHHYYGQNASGNPNLEDVTGDILNYWKRRALEAPHPMLSARYSDLVWDLSKIACQQNPSVSFAHCAIDKTIELYTVGNFPNRWEMLRRLDRALSISISIGDNGRKERLIEVLWGFLEGSPEPTAYFVDVVFKTKGLALNEDRRTDFLKKFVEKAIHPKSIDPISRKDFVIRLAKELRRSALTDSIDAVLNSYIDGVIALSSGANGLLGSAWLKDSYDGLNEAGFRKHAHRLVSLLQEKQRLSVGEFATFSVPMSITKDELDAFANEMVRGTFNEVIARAAFYFVVTRQDAEASLKNKEHSFLDSISKDILDEDGRVVARIGSIEDDFESNLVFETSQTVQLKAPFLRFVLERILVEHPNLYEQLISTARASAIFPTGSISIVEKSLNAYAQNDYVTMLHLLVPQLEAVIRNLHRLVDGDPYRPDGSGGLSLRTLDDLLRDDPCERSFGSDVCFFLRVLLTDRRSLNIRNRVCHGMLAEDQFSFVMADAGLHVLLLLLLLKPAKENG
ncbi:MAG: DUF4209 domain-containing protein [Nitrospira sp.]|nr:DUF4209 domain-containing protein [Nitrospira sp.]